ncbi:aminoacyl-tRNA hydrolase [archaeon CG10_big_fil_rev_8_21_14_0_10_43_11]|nr:MAG: aminoacyl-tRNA hydrolase [archaeon CG10_big_fil_rev_8_21_14_0_10_43_11]
MKQAIVLRKDVGMQAGKLVAQGAHASVDAAEKARKKSPDTYEQWTREGMKKIVLKVMSKEEIVELFERAKKKTIASLIKDAGKTQVEPGTITAIAIGPDHDAVIDLLVRDLKLL